MRSKWEATMDALVELESEMGRLTYWGSDSTVSPNTRRKYRQLEIRIEALGKAAKLLKAEE